MSSELMTIFAKCRQIIDVQYPHLDYVTHLELTSDGKGIWFHTPCVAGMLGPFDMETEMKTFSIYMSATQKIWKDQLEWRQEFELASNIVSNSRMALADALRPLPTPISDAIRWHFVPTE